MSIAVALTFCGCQTDQPPSDAQVLHCAPVFRQVGDNLTIRGFGPPITNTMPRTTLVLVDGANRVVVDFIGHRLPLILNTNTVYDFTVTPTRVSDQKMDLPSVFRVQKNGKTIYRYTDEMKKF